MLWSISGNLRIYPNINTNAMQYELLVVKISVRLKQCLAPANQLLLGVMSVPWESAGEQLMPNCCSLSHPTVNSHHQPYPALNLSVFLLGKAVDL